MKKKSIFIVFVLLLFLFFFGFLGRVSNSSLKPITTETEITTESIITDSTITESIITEASPSAFLIGSSNGEPIVYSSISDFNLPSLGDDHFVNTFVIDNKDLILSHSPNYTNSNFFFMECKSSESLDGNYYTGIKLSLSELNYGYVVKISPRDDFLKDFSINPSISFTGSYSSHFNSALNFEVVKGFDDIYIYFVPSNRFTMISLYSSENDPDSSFFIKDHINIEVYKMSIY